ncbi:hypothetical protein [Chthonomonas calidirosea]|uniref:hypothetical protein n=1 Tax=Chthonomonas calidirosea TaxID=454171 RepID=UPI0006EC957D|nr:hypothetical protein [Chthonomonas calidirosea]CEK14429.1 hypothetical protein CP488_00835 [Chthonomonas calidirosea]
MDDEIKQLLADEVETEAESHFGDKAKELADQALSYFGLKPKADNPDAATDQASAQPAAPSQDTDDDSSNTAEDNDQ